MTSRFAWKKPIFLRMTVIRLLFFFVLAVTSMRGQAQQWDPSPRSTSVNSKISSKRYKFGSTQMHEVSVETKPSVLAERIFLSPQRRPAQISDAQFEEEQTLNVNSQNTDLIKQDSIKDHVRSLWNSDSSKKVGEYKSGIHPQDNRLNQLEIFLFSGVLSTSAQSNLSYRNYSSLSGFYHVGTKLWLTPRLGVSGHYQSSLGSEVSTTGESVSRVPVTQEEAQFDLEIRDYFGMTRKSKNLSYGLSYFESKFSPNNNDTFRIKSKTLGYGLFLRGRIPHSPGYASQFSTFLAPKTQHQELSTQLLLNSGGSPDSMKYGLGWGGEIKFSRKNQVLWNLQYSLEKIQFSGSSNLPDLNTGATVQNVSVSNQQVQLSFGYQFGN